MKFLRGKTLRDPIYLKKSNDDYWMEGDVYNAACSCLDVVFRGRKNYFVESFSTKMVDFLTGLEYYKCSLTDREGDSHLFIFRVVDKVPGREEPKENKTVRAPEEPPTPPVQPEEPTPPPPPPEETPEETPEVEKAPAVEEPVEEDATQEILEEAKREVAVEEMNAELIRENLLTDDEESDKVKKSKPRKKGRGKKAKKISADD